MGRKLTVAAIQITSELGQKERNWVKARELIAHAASLGAQIVCLPELFLQGYSLPRAAFVTLAETQEQVLHRAQPVAEEFGVYLIVPYAEAGEVPGIVYNSALLCAPDSITVGNTRKVYLWGEEKLKFRPGHNFPVFNTPIGRIAVLICYDAEFPEPPRIVALEGAEIVFVPSVWSTAASNRWNIELAAAALYNQYFVVGVNTIGEGICGRSRILNPRGETVAEASSNKEEVLCISIDLEEIDAYRSEVPYFCDLNPDTFSQLGSVGLKLAGRR